MNSAQPDDPGSTRLCEQVARVLADEASYDDLDERAQAVVRASWSRQIERRAGELHFGQRLRDAGAPWPEADEQGAVVYRHADD